MFGWGSDREEGECVFRDCKIGSAWGESGSLGLTSSSMVDPWEAVRANLLCRGPPRRPLQGAELESGKKGEAYSPHARWHL